MPAHLQVDAAAHQLPLLQACHMKQLLQLLCSTVARQHLSAAVWHVSLVLQRHTQIHPWWTGPPVPASVSAQFNACPFWNGSRMQNPDRDRHRGSTSALRLTVSPLFVHAGGSMFACVCCLHEKAGDVYLSAG